VAIAPFPSQRSQRSQRSQPAKQFETVFAAKNTVYYVPCISHSKLLSLPPSLFEAEPLGAAIAYKKRNQPNNVKYQTVSLNPGSRFFEISQSATNFSRDCNVLGLRKSSKDRIEKIEKIRSPCSCVGVKSECSPFISKPTEGSYKRKGPSVGLTLCTTPFLKSQQSPYLKDILISIDTCSNTDLTPP